MATIDGGIQTAWEQLCALEPDAVRRAAGVGYDAASETFTVTHLKGTVKRKKLSCGEKRYVSRRAFSLSSSLPLPQFHSVSVSVSTAPVTHQDSGHDGEALIH